MDGTGDASWQLARRVVSLGVRPCVMGILNVTPDSFSDGARHSDPGRAVEHALRMVEEGADIIDIGGESTRPGAPPVPLKEELARVLPVLERLAGTIRVPISIDTTKAEVARIALAAGAEIVNDISGLTFDPGMAGVVAVARAGLVIMHTRGTPTEMQSNTAYGDLVAEVRDFLALQASVAVSSGVAPASIVIDPGIGFGKDPEGNLSLLRALPDLARLGYPVMIGTSRKSFIGRILGRGLDERVHGTAATVVFGLLRGARIFRVHDVGAMRDALDMTAALMGAGPELTM